MHLALFTKSHSLLAPKLALAAMEHYAKPILTSKNKPMPHVQLGALLMGVRRFPTIPQIDADGLNSYNCW